MTIKDTYTKDSKGNVREKITNTDRQSGTSITENYHFNHKGQRVVDKISQTKTKKN